MAGQILCKVWAHCVQYKEAWGDLRRDYTASLLGITDKSKQPKCLPF